MNTDWRILLVLSIIAGGFWLYEVCRNEKKVNDLNNKHDEDK